MFSPSTLAIFFTICFTICFYHLLGRSGDTLGGSHVHTEVRADGVGVDHDDDDGVMMIIMRMIMLIMNHIFFHDFNS